MSNAPGDSGSSSTTSSYVTSTSTATSATTKRAPVYRRSLSLEQSQNMKEAEVFLKTIQQDYFNVHDFFFQTKSTSSYTEDEEPPYSYRSRTVDRDPSLDR